MFKTSFITYPAELAEERTYVELFIMPSKREVTSVLRQHGSGRFGIVENSLWLWRGDVFHGTVMREMWSLGIYKQWTDWEEKLYFERSGRGVLWSTKPYFDVYKNDNMLKHIKYAYPRTVEIKSGTTLDTIYTFR